MIFLVKLDLYEVGENCSFKIDDVTPIFVPQAQVKSQFCTLKL